MTASLVEVEGLSKRFAAERNLLDVADSDHLLDGGLFGHIRIGLDTHHFHPHALEHLE